MKLLLLVLSATILYGQTTINGGRTILGPWDSSGASTTKPIKSGTSLPATCAIGEMYFKTDATAGSNVYGCTATNTWTLQSGVTIVGDCTTGDCYQAVVANRVYAGPASGAAAPGAMRVLVSADIPNNAADTSGKATTAGTADTTVTLTNGDKGAFTCTTGVCTLDVSYQPSDQDLTDIAALSCSENQIIKRNGAGTWVCAADSGGGGGASVDLTDFKASVAGAVLTIPAGRARIGNYAPVAIAAGGATFTAGSGDVKVFIDQNNNLVCHMATGIAATQTGSLTCSNVTTPTYPANSIPIADLTVAPTTFYVTIDSDDRAFLSNRGIAAGTGISIADSGGVASIGIDTATVPQLGAGSNDFTGVVSALEHIWLNSSQGTCDVANRGRVVMVQGGAGVADTFKVCSKDAANAYDWRTLL